jgi:tetratricopeptide (TPR) repeat protein
MRTLVAIAMGFIVACSQGDTPQSTSSRPALAPVMLPDLSSASESVQTQVRNRYAELERAIEDRTVSNASLANAYGDMGKLFMAAEYYDAAQSCLANAQTLAPNEMRWPYYLGHVFRLKNDPTRAATGFEQALAVQADHVPTLVWLGEMRLSLNQPEAAEAVLLRAHSLQPKSAAIAYGRGRAALAMKEYASAVRYFEEALMLQPVATRIHYPLAMAYRALGQQDRAEAHLRRRGDGDVPVADPLLVEVTGLLQNAAAYEARGSQALESKQWSEAVAQLSKAVELAPDNAFTRLNLGTALYMQGNADGALAQYREALRVSPTFAQAHFVIGAVLESRGRDAEAIDAFSRAVSNDPTNLEARSSLADALRRNGRIEESLKQYAEILRLNPTASQASFGYAMGLVRLGRYQEARNRLDAGVKAFPGQLGFPHALARLLAAAPDDRVRDGARASLLIAALLKNQRTLALTETMAMVQAELGRFDDAVRWQRDAIDLARQAGRSDVIPHLTQNLRLYEAKRASRMPWADDDPVHHPRPSP